MCWLTCSNRSTVKSQLTQSQCWFICLWSRLERNYYFKHFGYFHTLVQDNVFHVGFTFWCLSWLWLSSYSTHKKRGWLLKIQKNLSLVFSSLPMNSVYVCFFATTLLISSVHYHLFNLFFFSWASFNSSFTSRESSIHFLLISHTVFSRPLMSKCRGELLSLCHEEFRNY